MGRTCIGVAVAERRFGRESAYPQSVSPITNIVISAPEKERSRQSSAKAPGAAATGDPAGGRSETAVVREGGIAIRAGWRAGALPRTDSVGR